MNDIESFLIDKAAGAEAAAELALEITQELFITLVEKGILTKEELNAKLEIIKSKSQKHE